jgi:hypothetical protein
VEFLVIIKSSIYLFRAKGLSAFCALVDFIGQFVIYELIGEIDSVKPNGKTVNTLELPVLAEIT